MPVALRILHAKESVVNDLCALPAKCSPVSRLLLVQLTCSLTNLLCSQLKPALIRLCVTQTDTCSNYTTNSGFPINTLDWPKHHRNNSCTHQYVQAVIASYTGNPSEVYSSMYNTGCQQSDKQSFIGLLCYQQHLGAFSGKVHALGRYFLATKVDCISQKKPGILITAAVINDSVVGYLW